ncbi:MAG: hypothetical protein LC624_08795, partial [Halobacteriales archaeon]|nr:hypothetical protein [Halobacteriales archaeon]
MIEGELACFPNGVANNVTNLVAAGLSGQGAADGTSWLSAPHPWPHDGLTRPFTTIGAAAPFLSALGTYQFIKRASLGPASLYLGQVGVGLSLGGI